jgi:hypothetical protein
LKGALFFSYHVFVCRGVVLLPVFPLFLFLFNREIPAVVHPRQTDMKEREAGSKSEGKDEEEAERAYIKKASHRITKQIYP